MTDPEVHRFRLGADATRLRRGVSELQRLGLEEFLQTELAQLAAAAGLLEAAEGSQRIEAAAVHVHLAGAEAAGDALGASGVAGPDAAGQAVHRVVGDADRVVVVLVRQDRQHRTEDLLPRDGHRRLHAREDGRLDVVALRQAFWRVGAAQGEQGAFLDARADVLADALPLLGRCERTQPRLRRARVPRLELGRRALRDLQRLVLALARDEHAGPRGAGLAAVEEGVGDRDSHRLVEIRVLEDDARRLAAQLQGDPLDGARRQLRYAPARGGRPGERDHVDARMAHE